MEGEMNNLEEWRPEGTQSKSSRIREKNSTRPRKARILTALDLKTDRIRQIQGIRWRVIPRRKRRTKKKEEPSLIL